MIGASLARWPGRPPYDAATAARAGANLLALSSVLSPEVFRQGSGAGAAEGSEARPAIWEKPKDFATKIGQLTTAADAMQAAAPGSDLAAGQGAMRDLGAACGACHETYRQQGREGRRRCASCWRGWPLPRRVPFGLACPNAAVPYRLPVCRAMPGAASGCSGRGVVRPVTRRRALWARIA